MLPRGSKFFSLSKSKKFVSFILRILNLFAISIKATTSDLLLNKPEHQPIDAKGYFKKNRVMTVNFFLLFNRIFFNFSLLTVLIFLRLDCFNICMF